MMGIKLIDLKKIDTNDYLLYFIVLTYPLSLILGNFVINLYFILVSLSFFLNFNESKKFLKKKIILILFFFFISLIINVIFSLNPLNSFPRIIKLVLIIFFTCELIRFFFKYTDNILNIIFKSWFLILLIIYFDIIFEVIVGHNIIGFSSNYEGRISSFFGEELIVGSFIHGFSLFFFSYVLINNKKNYLIFLFLVLSIILISFIIGERANFIKLLFSIIILIFFGFKSSFSKKIIPIILVFLLVITFTSLNKDYKIRYHSQVKEIFAKKGLETYLKNSIYGAHQNAALMIFKDYPIFGIGVKNFRIVSGDIKYENPDYLKTESRQSNHPHQIHMEFLSETGMFGYISFIIFILYSCWLGIKNYFKSKNLYLLSSIIYILSLMLPIIPSGSFLSSYSSGVFWINYAIMASYIVNKRKGLF